MTCQSCGAELPADSRFCRSCGTRQAPAAGTASQEDLSLPPPNQATQPPPAAGPRPRTGKQPDFSQTDNKPWYQKWWGITVLVLLSMSILSAIFDDTDTSTSTPTAQDEPDVADKPTPAEGPGLDNVAEPDQQQRSCKDVHYFVEGSASSADITMQRAQGTEQASINVPLTSESGPGFRTGCYPNDTFVYISAQNRGESGTIECRIEADGETISQARSSGAYAIAQCDAQVR